MIPDRLYQRAGESAKSHCATERVYADDVEYVRADLQPIETADKTGYDYITEVPSILILTDDDEWHVAYWENYFVSPGWTSTDSGEIISGVTHWLPLPSTSTTSAPLRAILKGGK